MQVCRTKYSELAKYCSIFFPHLFASKRTQSHIQYTEMAHFLHPPFSFQLYEFCLQFAVYVCITKWLQLAYSVKINKHTENGSKETFIFVTCIDTRILFMSEKRAMLIIFAFCFLVMFLVWLWSLPIARSPLLFCNFNHFCVFCTNFCCTKTLINF